MGARALTPGLDVVVHTRERGRRRRRRSSFGSSSAMASTGPGGSWKELRWVVLMLLLVCLGVLQQQEENVGRVGATILGVNWGTVAFNPLPNSIVVKMLQANNITKVKLFDANPQVIKSMAGTNIEVMVAATNDELASLASSPAAAAAWVQENVTQYIGGNGVNIK